MKFVCEGEEVSLKVISEVSGKSEAQIIDIVRNTQNGNTFEIDGWEYEFHYDNKNILKADSRLKVKITDRVASDKDFLDGIKVKRMYTYKDKEYTITQFSEILGVTRNTMRTKTKGLKSFNVNGIPVTVREERKGEKYDISKDGEWVKGITLSEAQEFTGHRYTTLKYHCARKSYTGDGWCIRQHKKS